MNNPSTSNPIKSGSSTEPTKTVPPAPAKPSVMPGVKPTTPDVAVPKEAVKEPSSSPTKAL